jgi:predicted Zn-dependent protease
MPAWLQNVEAGNEIEKALYRFMPLPGGAVVARRPPREVRPLLDSLVSSRPRNSELYPLRALSEEQQLDFDAAEKDWKLYTANAADPLATHFALADFYHRRLRPADEIHALEVIAQSAVTPADNLLAPSEQRSWRAFERIFAILRAQALPPESFAAQYRAWIARYPQEPSLYARYLDFLLAQKDSEGALELIASYGKAFPQDQVFSLRARAFLDYKKGDIEQGLAVYDQAFQPLWPGELVQSYFDLLRQTRTLRKFFDHSRAGLAANPDDLGAASRIFFYYQQQGKNDAAEQVLREFRLRKETRRVAWRPEELYTLARLSEQINSAPEAARYYYALYNAPPTPEFPDGAERGLAGITNLLLTAPEQPIGLGSGSLSMYQDIATLDRGPSFLNGILSLLLNSTEPQAHFAEEEQRALPYFHRARAAELLALLDQKFPKSPRRPGLHARLLQDLANYGEGDALIRGGREFLENFPNAPERTNVSLLIADALARTGRASEEFAIYDAVLKELAARAQNVPLGAAAFGSYDYSLSATEREAEWESQPDTESGAAAEGDENQEVAPGGQSALNARRQAARQAFSLATKKAEPSSGPRSMDYSRVLERYLSRLVSKKQIPDALRVLRQEVDRNPNDPGLYERLAQFLDQNRLDSELEETYRRAIKQFPGRSWYHKLARWYLGRKRRDDVARLTEEVVKIFAGSELENYFDDIVRPVGPGLYLHLNLFAHERFPHNLTFVRNLLNAYRRPETHDLVAWERLMREHWFEDNGLRAQFFEYLSARHSLDTELETLRHMNPFAPAGHWADLVHDDPVAGQWIAGVEVWRSHFEAAKPLLVALAAEYPADFPLGREASAVCRSLAYFDPQATDAAVAIEKNLLASAPANLDTLARIGDIYADRELFAQAAPFWNRMAEVHPGESGGYLEAATVFWDYYLFDDALRLLDAGRKNLARPDFYRYEAGPIYENKRQYPRAVEEYVKGALGENSDGQSASRLLRLAARPALRTVADAAAARAADAAAGSLAAIRLRVAVLETQSRKPDAEAFLSTAVDRAISIELVEDVEALAQEKSMEAVRQRALERQAALTTDPVNRLELRYALVRFYEGKKDFAAAQRNIEALYRENPKILGVVRATVDFYWRMKMQQPAIDVLLAAAKVSYPALQSRFNFEAARKATDAGNTALARQLLEPLLSESPYDGEYLAAMADTYARAGDDRGLREFYLARIETFRQAPLSPDDCNVRIATLRRGLILALTRLKDYPGATDQYIEIINKFPEDDSLTTEAALYALRYSLQAKLISFYTKTVADSPQDFRWPMVLGRLDTQFEQYPAAIDAFAKAVAVRPDRVDLHTARADLLQRLLRFDEAIAEYERLYDLSYRDPKWMQQIAQTRARQGLTDAAVAALKTAFIDGRPPQATNFFTAASLAESWGLLEPARNFADQGVGLAGDDLFGSTENQSGAQLYVRVVTRLRRQSEAFARLEAALAAASQSANSPAAVIHQAERQGIAAVTDREWRERVAAQRRATGRAGMQRCLKEMGATVERYFTPEEKVEFTSFLAGRREADSSADLAEFLVPAAETAGLAGLEAKWRKQLMLGDPQNSGVQMARLIELQTERLKFSELAADLEALAAALPSQRRASPLERAAEAYRAAGGSVNELRVLSQYEAAGWLGHDEVEQRYFELLLAQQPNTLVAHARKGPRRDQAANFALARGDFKLAADVVAARSDGLPPVWRKAYLALTGLYFADTGTEVDSAFRDALDASTIGARLGKPVDRTQKLAGDIWFYYGSRYGEYLGTERKPNVEDYLPAVLEQTPGRAAAYVIIAEYYAGSGDLPRAIADLNRCLELSPDSVDIHNRIAVLYWQQNDRLQAFAHWNSALTILDKQAGRLSLPESFWNDFGVTMKDIGSRHVAAQFQPAIESLLRAYLRRNGAYRFPALAREAYQALGATPASAAWLLELADGAPRPVDVLISLAEARWIPLVQREPFFGRILELKQDEVARAHGLEKESARGVLEVWQVRWIGYLLAMRQLDRARAALDALPPETQTAEARDLVPLDLRIVAAARTLDAAIESWRADPQRVPPLEFLRAGAAELRKSGDKSSARKILEFVFTREIGEHQLSATNLLGLAEIRLDSGDMAGALDLLRRLTLVVGEPFQNLESAAALLEKTSHPAEAAVFLDQLVKAAPWNPAYRIRLAKAAVAAGKDSSSARSDMAAIASSLAAPYEFRAQAASPLAGSKASSALGSAELGLLASPDLLSADKANRPFFSSARLQAAQRIVGAELRIALLRAALEDYPHRDDARIPLFRAALASQQYQLAHSALAPLLKGGFLRRTVRVPEYRGEQEGAVGEAAETQDTESDGNLAPPDTLGKIPEAEQAAVAAEFATVLERLNLPNVTQYLQIAIHLEPTAARRAELRGHLAAVRAANKRLSENAARRPIVHDALEQDCPVRPQLVAQALEKITPPAEKSTGRPPNPAGKSSETPRRQP